VFFFGKSVFSFIVVCSSNSSNMVSRNMSDNIERCVRNRLPMNHHAPTHPHESVQRSLSSSSKVSRQGRRIFRAAVETLVHGQTNTPIIDISTICITAKAPNTSTMIWRSRRRTFSRTSWASFGRPQHVQQTSGVSKTFGLH